MGEVRHVTLAELRVHDLPLALPLAAHKRVFFEPRPGTLKLFARFNEPVKQLVDTWWDKIEDSRKFAANLPDLQTYHKTLRPGDITLVGLIAEGGQGMRTANNARFLAYLEGTPQARDLEAKAEAWTHKWQADDKIAPDFANLLRAAGGNPDRPLADRAAWEAAVHGLRVAFSPVQLGFGRTALFRIASRSLIATDADFRFAFASRKAELLTHWRGAREIDPFWDDRMEIDGNWITHSALRQSAEVTDADFCDLCQHIQLWIDRENLTRASGTRIPRTVISLRSSENYTDPIDAPRIATIYNGLYLRPSAQGILLETPSDCLEVIEKSVNWEAEKLYGVEGQGPFDEFWKKLPQKNSKNAKFDLANGCDLHAPSLRSFFAANLSMRGFTTSAIRVTHRMLRRYLYSRVTLFPDCNAP